MSFPTKSILDSRLESMRARGMYPTYQSFRAVALSLGMTTAEYEEWASKQQWVRK